MKIFLATHFQGNNQPSSLTWYYNLYLPLKDISDKVILFNFDLFGMSQHQDLRTEKNFSYSEQNRPLLEKELLNQIDEAERLHGKIDVFLSYFANSYCSNEVIKEIEGKGIITINWFCNASYQFHLVDKICSAYQYSLVPEKFRIEDYKGVGANPVYFQESANPKHYFPILTQKKYNVSFVGGRYVDRYKYLKEIYQSHKNLKIFGTGWKGSENSLSSDFLRKLIKKENIKFSNYGGFVDDSSLNEVFNGSKINLGFTKCADGSTPQVRLRDFEITMSGNFYLTEYNEELSQFFEEGKEIEFFRDGKELLEKVKFYLKNEFERFRITKNCYYKSINAYSTQKKYTDLFKTIGIIK